MEIGVSVWVRLPTRGWLRGIIERKDAEHIVVQVPSADGAVANETHPFASKEIGSRVFLAGDEKEDAAIEDISALEFVNEPCILNVLRQRYHQEGEKKQQIYTWAGCTLLSVNPYEETQLFTSVVFQKFMDQYRSARSAEHAREAHLFTTAIRALTRLYSVNDNGLKGVNQSLIISGESGAGKSESTKYVMSFLAQASADGNNRLKRANSTPKFSLSASEAKNSILQSSPILESFGNARTTRNGNSSRFGKYIRLQFDTHNGLSGARIQTCLLEKVRIVSHETGERNFHIFYQFCKGLDAKGREVYCLQEANHYHYLNQGGSQVASNANDADMFSRTCEAMKAIGFTAPEMDNVFKILSAVLHIGNMTLANAVDLKTTDTRSSRHSVGMASYREMDIAAKFLGLQSEAFYDVICSKKIKAGTEQVVVQLSKEQALTSRDALAKEIYSRLFDWIVERINRSVAFDKAPLFIGVLDIFGFEIFKKNSLEQLCINYANEKIQQLFVALVISEAQTEYEQEEINWTKIQNTSSLDRLKLMESRPFGLLPLVDEQCLMPRGTDQSLVNKLNSSHSANKFFSAAPALSPNKLLFTINHYAGHVTYSADGFCLKNRDQMNPEAVKLLVKSSNPLLVTILAPLNMPTGRFHTKNNITGAPFRRSESGNRLVRSMAAQFRDQLSQLLAIIHSTDVHFIRCVKPNDQNAPRAFDADCVGKQLHNCGIINAASIARQGFPVRIQPTVFLQRYKFLRQCESDNASPQSSMTPSEWNSMLCCADLVLYALQTYSTTKPENPSAAKDVFGKDEPEKRAILVALNSKLLSRGYQFGRTKIYLKSGALDELEEWMGGKYGLLGSRIQRAGRMFLARRRLALLKRSVAVLQAFSRRIVEKKRHQDRLSAASKQREEYAVKIQALERGRRARRKYNADLKSIVVLQTFVRRRAQAKKHMLVRREARKSVDAATAAGAAAVVAAVAAASAAASSATTVGKPPTSPVKAKHQEARKSRVAELMEKAKKLRESSNTDSSNSIISTGDETAQSLPVESPSNAEKGKEKTVKKVIKRVIRKKVVRKKAASVESASAAAASIPVRGVSQSVDTGSPGAIQQLNSPKIIVKAKSEPRISQSGEAIRSEEAEVGVEKELKKSGGGLFSSWKKKWNNFGALNGKETVVKEENVVVTEPTHSSLAAPTASAAPGIVPAGGDGDGHEKKSRDGSQEKELELMGSEDSFHSKKKVIVKKKLVKRVVRRPSKEKNSAISSGGMTLAAAMVSAKKEQEKALAEEVSQDKKVELKPVSTPKEHSRPSVPAHGKVIRIGSAGKQLTNSAIKSVVEKQPVDINEQAKPVETTNPVELAKPTKPTEPVELAKPTKPVDPVEPAKTGMSLMEMNLQKIMSNLQCAEKSIKIIEEKSYPEDDQQRRTLAAITIQCLFRTKMALAETDWLRQEAALKKRTESISTIQRAVRAYILRLREYKARKTEPETEPVASPSPKHEIKSLEDQKREEEALHLLQNKSATVVQSYMRGVFCRKDFLARKQLVLKAVVKIQSTFRMHRFRKFYLSGKKQRLLRRKIQCARTMQRFMRAYMFRRRLKKRNFKVLVHRSARTIQALLHIQRAKKLAKRTRLERMITAAVITIQCAMRMYLARKARRRLVVRRIMAQMATRIQSGVRMMLAKKRRRRLVRLRDLNVSACVVQSFLKIVRAKRIKLQKRELRRRINAARALQAMRFIQAAKKQRAVLRIERTRNEAARVLQGIRLIQQCKAEKLQLRRVRMLNAKATVLQTAARGLLARKKLSELREQQRVRILYNTIKVQSAARMFLAIFELERRQDAAKKHRLNTAALVIQCAVRVFLAKVLAHEFRQEIKEEYAAVVIQCATRVYMAKLERELLEYLNEIKVQNDSVVRLQCFLRMGLAKNERRARASRVRIQCAVRMWLARRELNSRRSAVLVQSFGRLVLAKVKVSQLRRQRSALYIQCAFRRNRAQRKVFFMRKHQMFTREALRIQCAVRKFHAKKRLHALKQAARRQSACVRIQCVVRVLLAKNRLVQAKAEHVLLMKRLAVVKIQSAARARYALKLRVRRKSATRTLQRWGRIVVDEIMEQRKAQDDEESAGFADTMFSMLDTLVSVPSPVFGAGKARSRNPSMDSVSSYARTVRSSASSTEDLDSDEDSDDDAVTALDLGGFGGGGGSNDDPIKAFLMSLDTSSRASSNLEDEMVSDVTISTTRRRRSSTVDVSQTDMFKEGSSYAIVWEEGILGLRMKMDPSRSLPSVTKINTDNSSALGIHLVKSGDFLVKIGGLETLNHTFNGVINMLKNAEKPCTLEFIRGRSEEIVQILEEGSGAVPQRSVQSDERSKQVGVSTGESPSKGGALSDGASVSVESHPATGPATLSPDNFKHAIAKKIAAKIVEIQEEELSKMPPLIEPVLEESFEIPWKTGPLGISLVPGKDCSFPQVTRITGKSSFMSEDSDHRVAVGHFLVGIGSYSTDEKSFNESIKQLQKVKKPVMLRFCPSSSSTKRPKLTDNEREFTLEKKQHLGFTLKSENNRLTVASVGKSGKGKGKLNSKLVHSVKTEDKLTWINEDYVADMDFKEALIKLRQAKRPLTIRFEKSSRRGTSKKSPTAKSPSSRKHSSRSSTSSTSSNSSSSATSGRKDRERERDLGTNRAGLESIITKESSGTDRVVEFDVMWHRGVSLGLTLKPDEDTGMPLVTRLTGKNPSKDLQKVSPGDVLVAANKKPLPVQKKFKNTLEMLSKLPKPTVLRFQRREDSASSSSTPTSRRTSRPSGTGTGRMSSTSSSGSSRSKSQSRSPSSSSRTSSFGQRQGEYTIEWDGNHRLGLVFGKEKDGDVKYPVVTKMDSEAKSKPNSYINNVKLGDCLTAIGDAKLRNKSSSQAMKIISASKFPVMLHFRRRTVARSNPNPAEEL